MADILSTSVSGLLAFQQALDVTSNNVSNSATPGYSVQRINLAEGPGQSTGGGYFGSGVNVQSITRSYDETLAQQVRSSNASYSSFNTVATQASQIDNMLSNTGTGLTAEECERLFTPYYTSKAHGTGLGLAIVQSVVSDQGGRITVRSEPGSGTTFMIELPGNSDKLQESGPRPAAADVAIPGGAH